MSVPFLDVKAAYAELKCEIDEAIMRVLDGGWYILGEEVEKFESEYAHYCYASHCISVPFSHSWEKEIAASQFHRHQLHAL